jgi:hypothetical protein
MAKQDALIPYYFSVTNATTVHRSFINPAITSDIVLIQKTGLVLLEEEGVIIRGSVFRLSSDAPEAWSRDLHIWTDKGWRFKKKDPHKYATLPKPPRNAIAIVIDGVECWTMSEQTDEDVLRLRQLISRTPATQPIAVMAHSVIR